MGKKRARRSASGRPWQADQDDGGISQAGSYTVCGHAFHSCLKALRVRARHMRGNHHRLVWRNSYLHQLLRQARHLLHGHVEDKRCHRSGDIGHVRHHLARAAGRGGLHDAVGYAVLCQWLAQVGSGGAGGRDAEDDVHRNAMGTCGRHSFGRTAKDRRIARLQTDHLLSSQRRRHDGRVDPRLRPAVGPHLLASKHPFRIRARKGQRLWVHQSGMEHHIHLLQQRMARRVSRSTAPGPAPTSVIRPRDPPAAGTICDGWSRKLILRPLGGSGDGSGRQAPGGRNRSSCPRPAPRPRPARSKLRPW